MEVGVFEARNRLSELIDAAQRGEEVIVTRHGDPVVRLEPITRRPSLEALQALVDEVRRRREALPFRATWEEFKRDRDAGRR